MPVVEIPKNMAAVQVEIPSSLTELKDGAPEARELKRSCEGALYLQPGIKVVTKDELAYIKESRPDLHAQLRFVALTEEERAELKAETPKASAPAPATPPSPESGKGSGKK